MNARTLSIAMLAGLPMLYAGCGGDSLTLPSEGEPAQISIQSGSGEAGRVGTPLGDSLVALVTDTQNRPVPGATVKFVLTDDRGGGTVTPASAQTGADGTAKAKITLGSQAGQMQGQAQVPVSSGAAPIQASFTAMVLSGDANGIAMVSGDGQSGPVGDTLAAPLVVKITDASGNPISGVTVAWSPEGQGGVSETTTVTGEDGQTSVLRILGPNAGQQTTTATAEGLVGSPVTFSSTATAGNASRIEIVSGDNQEAPAGTQLHDDLVVRVLDQDGNPVPNRAVSWVIGTGGGTPTPETSQTDGDGKASTKWTLGGTPGANTLNAVVSGIGSVTFHANGSGTGSPSNLAITTQPPGSVGIGETLNPAPVVQVRDAAGHDLTVPGVEVTAALTGGGSGQLQGTQTVATDGNGRAQFSDLRITGTGSYRLLFAAEGFRSATSNKIDVNKAGTTTTISQDIATSDPGQVVTFTVGVNSSSPGVPSGTVEVKASDSEKCTVAAPSGSCQIIFTGTGSRTVTATYSGDAVFATSSATINHDVNVPVPPPDNPPTAAPDTYTASSGQTLSVDAAHGVLANDTDPDQGTTLTAQLATLPTVGIVALQPDGSFTYFPGLGAPGTADSFTYTVSDGSLFSTATVTINIQ